MSAGIELRHLRYFVAVAEELHFRRAAERLQMTQPPLSQQIRALEQEVGAELLVRNRRTVELTEAGATLLREARAVLQAAEEAVETTRRVARGEVGALSIGFVGSAMYDVVPAILQMFRRDFPDVALRLRELPTARQVEAIALGRIDVGFIRPPAPREDLTIETLHRQEVVVALPVAHELASHRRVRLEELRGEPFVLLSRADSPGLHAPVADALAAAGATAAIIQEVAEMQTVIALVAAGLGVSLVPASVAALEREGVTYRPLSGTGPVVELAVARMPDRHSTVLDNFLQIARELAKRQTSADDAS